MARLASIWIVTTPRKNSTLADIVFEADVAGLILQVRGGLSPDDEPTLFTDRDEALAEGERRLEAYRLYRATLDGRTDGAR